VKLDKKTGSNLLQWPVAEVESLRLKSDEFKNLKVKPGAVVSLDIETATQVCIHFANIFCLNPMVLWGNDSW
jgi:beta-fructofuranosidase